MLLTLTFGGKKRWCFFYRLESQWDEVITIKFSPPKLGEYWHHFSKHLKYLKQIQANCSLSSCWLTLFCCLFFFDMSITLWSWNFNADVFEVQGSISLHTVCTWNDECKMYWSSIEYLMNCTILYIFVLQVLLILFIFAVIPSWICHHFCTSCVSWPWPIPAAPPFRTSRENEPRKSVREKGGAIFERLRNLWEEQRKRFGLEILDGKSIVSKTLAGSCFENVDAWKWCWPTNHVFYACMFVLNCKW